MVTSSGKSDHIGLRLPVLDIRALKAETRLDSEAAIRALCHSAYLGDHTALCRVLGIYKMFVDTHDIGIAPHLMLEGYWEMWVTEAMIGLVREGMVVADVGANIGYFTLLMADLVGAKGRVHAFEPNPGLIDLLGRNLSVNGYWGRVSVHHMALGDRDGEDLALYVPPGEPKNGHLVSSDMHGEHVVRVGCRRMDSILPWDALDLAKIDVEGAEQLVWAGMQGLLDNGRLKTVLIEFASGRYDDPQDFLKRLMAPGFTLGRIDVVHGVVPTTVEDVMSFDPLDDVMLVLQR